MAALPSPPAFTWSDAFLLGFAPIDATHREFVTLVDRMLRAGDAELAGFLAAFARHAEAHFEQEGAWMRETGFPAMQCHVDEHDAVMRSVRGVGRRVSEGDFEAGRRLAVELARWFPAHADHLDSALAQWLVKRRYGGVPIVVRRGAQG